jgi:hypothetical protein
MPEVLDRVRQENDRLKERVREFKDEHNDEPANKCLREAGEEATLLGQDILSIGEREPQSLGFPGMKPLVAHWEAMSGKFGEGLDKLTK